MDNEAAYLELLRKVLREGKLRSDRTGTGTRSVFGHQLDLSLDGGIVPVVTTKRLAWKSVIRELVWFLQGDTDARHLQEKKVTIWDGNTRRAFLDARGLADLPEGDIGAGYGFQWRHFGATYQTCETDYTGQGVDQIQALLHGLRTDPYSRRHFMTAWNPAALPRMALPPCHVSAQFYVDDADAGGGERRLSCHMYQRSVDAFLGLPFNMLSYAALTALLAKATGMRPHRLIVSMGDVHIYQNHVDQVRLQLSREPRPPPRLTISDAAVDLKSADDVTESMFELHGYDAHDPIAAPMSV